MSAKSRWRVDIGINAQVCLAGYSNRPLYTGFYWTTLSQMSHLFGEDAVGLLTEGMSCRDAARILNIISLPKVVQGFYHPVSLHHYSLKPTSWAADATFVLHNQKLSTQIVKRPSCSCLLSSSCSSSSAPTRWRKCKHWLAPSPFQSFTFHSSDV